MATKTAAKPGKRLSPLARDIVAGLKEYGACKHGEKTNVNIYTFPKVPEDFDVNGIRGKLGMTQEQFTTFGFSLSAIRHWEARRRIPEGPARALLKVIDRDPGVVLEALHH